MAGFYLRTEDLLLDVYFPFGEAPPKTTGGGPIIARTTRPKRKTLTDWAGRNEYQITLSFQLADFERSSTDGSASRFPQQIRSPWLAFDRKMRILGLMQGQRPGDPEAPHLMVLADQPGSIEQAYDQSPQKRWWLEEINEGDNTLRDLNGRIYFVEGTITLTEVVEDEGLGKLKAGGKKNKPKKYEIKKGDTLKAIAKKYKIKGGWHELAKLNKIRDPKKIRVGQVIRLS